MTNDGAPTSTKGDSFGVKKTLTVIATDVRAASRAAVRRKGDCVGVDIGVFVGICDRRSSEVTHCRYVDRACGMGGTVMVT